MRENLMKTIMPDAWPSARDLSFGQVAERIWDTSWLLAKLSHTALRWSQSREFLRTGMLTMWSDFWKMLKMDSVLHLGSSQYGTFCGVVAGEGLASGQLAGGFLAIC